MCTAAGKKTDYFTVNISDTATRARLGTLSTAHGTIETPCFMPVGTQGTVKGLTPRQIQEAQTQILLGNTYHLFLRPGLDVIKQHGGLHSFMGWDGPILTDSGGFQVFSLAPLRKIRDHGVEFQSHIDGSTFFLGPKEAIGIQETLGSDIMMVFDECAPYPCAEKDMEKTVSLTLAWAEESKKARTSEQLLFGIIQGGIYDNLRLACLEGLMAIDFDGYALGGLSVGEPQEEMLRITSLCAQAMPQEKPRYLMGVGTPLDLVHAVSLGIDMFDCVIPTRNGRNGAFFTKQGPSRILRSEYKEALEPLDKECSCSTCRRFSKAYVRHLMNAREMLGPILLSIHNVFFYNSLMVSMRDALRSSRFPQWKREFLSRYDSKGDTNGL